MIPSKEQVDVLKRHIMQNATPPQAGVRYVTLPMDKMIYLLDGVSEMINRMPLLFDNRISPASRRMLLAFYTGVATKFIISEMKHEWKDKWATADQAVIQADLAAHMPKGDPIDVAIYCAILHFFGWPTVPRELVHDDFRNSKPAVLPVADDPDAGG